MINDITTEPVIVGIDPGTTSAVVVLDLDHTVKGYESAKNFSKDQIIEFIVSHGKPLLIATDVAAMPSLVEGIASNMGARTFSPNDDLKASYKERLTDQLSVQVPDTHTMDAAAAAEYAYREYKDKLDTILQKADDAGLPRAAQYDVVELVMHGELSTQAAINEVEKSNTPDDTGDNTDDTPGSQDWQQIAAQRQQQIEQLTDKVAHLEEYKETLDQLLDEAEQKGTATVDEQALRKRNHEINRLRSELEEKTAAVQRLKQRNEALQDAVARISDQDWIHVPQVPSLSQTAADIVYCDAYSGGPVSDTVDVVVTESGATDAYKSLESQGITVVERAALNRQVDVMDGYVVPPEELRQAISAADDASERFKEWLDAYRKRQTTS